MNLRLILLWSNKYNVDNPHNTYFKICKSAFCNATPVADGL